MAVWRRTPATISEAWKNTPWWSVVPCRVIFARVIPSGVVAFFVLALVILAPACAEEKPATAATAPVVSPPVAQVPQSGVPGPVVPTSSARPADAKHPVETAAPSSAGGTSAVVLDPSAVQGIIGRSAKTTDGEDMGRVVDLLVASSGQVRAAVLDFGGVLGVGARKVAVDWKVLSFVELAKDGPVQVLLTRNQIRVAPEYKSNEPVVVLEPTPEAKGEIDAKAKTSRPQSPPVADAKPDVSSPQRAGGRANK